MLMPGRAPVERRGNEETVIGATAPAICAETTWEEADRLAALQRYAILDTGREPAFDDVAELAADILNAPIAVVNFIAADRQWFKAEKGIGTDSLPLDVSICRHAILQPDVLVVPDLAKDARFEHNPLVDAADGLRFYAGALLQTPDGLPLGTLCVLDSQPRPEGITARQRRALKALAAQTMAQLELRRSNATAREESERLSAMFAQASVGMSEVGLDGRFLVVNDRLCELLGRPREEVLTLGVFDVTHPQDLAGNLPKFERMVDAGESFSLDQRYVRPDGRVVWANSSVTRLLDGQGRPRAALAVTTDITARKEAERRQTFLLELTDRTRHLAAPEAIVGANTRALGEELGAARVAYVDIDEARGLAFAVDGWTDGVLTNLPGEMRLSDFEGQILEHLRAGTTFRIDDSVVDPRTRDAVHVLEPIGARAIVSVPLLKSGCLLGNFNVHQSVPRVWTDAEVELIEAVAERTWEAVERARAEARLRDSEAELRLVTDSLPVLVSYVDRDGCYRFNNKAYEDWFGQAREAVAGRHVRDVLGEEAYEGVRPYIEAALAGETVTFSSRMPYKDAGTRYVEASYIPRRGAEGKVDGFYVLVADATERKAAETALRRRSEQLQGLAETAYAVASAATLDATLDEITRAARRIVGAHQSVVSLTHGDEWAQVIPYLELSEKYGSWSGYGTPADGSGIYALVCETNTPMRLTQAELEAHPRWRGFGAHAEDHPPMRGWLAAPLVGRDGRNLGLVQLSDKEDGSEFDENDEAIIVQLARLASAAIEQAQAENALRASEARLRAVVEAAPVGLVFADAAGRITGGNAQVERILGHPILPSENVDRYREWVGFHADGRRVEGKEYPLARALAGEERPELEVLYQRGDGRQAWVRFIAAAKRDDRGRIIGGVVASLDIDERRRTQEQLERLNETLESRVAEALAERKVFADIVEGAPATIMALDPEFNILASNGAAFAAIARIYGKQPKVGDNLLEMLRDMPEHQAQVRATWSRALAGEDFVIIDEFGDEKHERIAYEARFNALRDRFGNVIGAAHTAYDVTDRVRAQAELEAAQEALRQSQKMEAMGQLTGGVAHDFNNLLTPIVGSLDMLQRRGLGGEREQRLIEGAAQSAERAKTLVQRLLAFARRQPLQPVAVDIARLVHGMGDLVSSTTGPQIKVVVEASDDLPAAKADPNQVEMALLNLAVNARDAMPEGGTLRISATAERAGAERSPKLSSGSYVCLSVADTGIGMDEQTLARAIEPFFSTKGVGRGTGLGLSMVHGLASQLGGALTIDSRRGLGTDVRLWLPVSDTEVEPPRPASAPAARPAAGTALLVDDEELVRASTAQMLADLGYAVVEAASAEEAIERLDGGFAPDLLVTDHLMPGMNGTDLVRRVKQSHPSVQALLISGYAEADGVAPDLPRLTKPFRQTDLAASLAMLAGSTDDHHLP